MISKRQRLILWSGFVVLILLSGFAVWQTFALRGVIPFLLNDSSPRFGQLQMMIAGLFITKRRV
jgi:hypothetical protein